MDKHLNDWEWLLRDLDSVVGIMSRISWLRRYNDLISNQATKKEHQRIKMFLKKQGISPDLE